MMVSAVFAQFYYLLISKIFEMYLFGNNGHIHMIKLKV